MIIKIATTLIVFGLVQGCSHGEGPSDPVRPEELRQEHSFQPDRKHLDELRKEMPEDIKKSNDRLAEMLTRWKQRKTPPDELREKFDDEMRKMRQAFEKTISRKREDFNRHITDTRREFQERQKDQREDFLSEKPKGDRRSTFLDRQSTERTRFNSDLNDERDRFEDGIKEERKIFEADLTNRRAEFKQEFPEYQRIYKEMKLAEEKERENNQKQPPPYTGWPYKPDDAPPAGQKKFDVNKGGSGWPATDPSELNQVPTPPATEQ